MRDEHGDRAAVEAKVEHRLAPLLAQEGRQLGAREMHRLEVLQRRRAAQAKAQSAAHARMGAIAC